MRTDKKKQNPALIKKMARLEWFKYYNILKENHFVNLVILMQLQKECYDLFKIHLGDLFILIIIKLYKSQTVTHEQIYNIVCKVAKYSPSYVENALTRLAFAKLIKKRKKTIVLTPEGSGMIHRFELFFKKRYNEIKKDLPDL